MALVYKTTLRPKVVHAYVVGEFSLSAAKRHFMEIISAVEKQSNDKILVDGLGIIGNPETVERFYFGEFAAYCVRKYREESNRKNPQFAYVLQEPVLDPARLGEIVAVNRGMNIKAFDGLNAALEWLGLTAEDLLDS